MLETERLILRPPTLDDAPAMVELLAEKEIQLNTLAIPYPYQMMDAEDFIRFCQNADENDRNFALVRRADGQFLGMCGLLIRPDHHRAMLGYWIGKPFWNQGYTTEAVRRLIRYGFEERGLAKIFAECFEHNIGSARVMEKAGMQREGFLRQQYYHRLQERMMDVYYYGIIRKDYPSGY